MSTYLKTTSLLSVHSDTDEPIDLELPNKWLWDIVDEFIYQVSVIPNLIPIITFP